MKKSEKIAEINNILNASIAAEEAVRAKAEADYRGRVAELMKMAQEDREKAADDPDEPQDCDQPTQWLDGSHGSCVRMAHEILDKLPKLNYPKETFYIEISPSYFGGCDLDLRYINIISKEGGVTSCELRPVYEPDVQAQKVDLWLKEVEVQMEKAKEIMEEEREEAGNE